MKEIFSKVIDKENLATKELENARNIASKIIIDAEAVAKEKLKKEEELFSKEFNESLEKYRIEMNNVLENQIYKFEEMAKENSKKDPFLQEKGSDIVLKILIGEY